MFRFYRECFARAFSGKFFLIEKWSGGLGLLAVAVTKFGPVPEWMDGMIEDDLPLYFFMLVFFGTVFVGFITAPYTVYKEEREARFLLEQARKPRLKIFIKDSAGITAYDSSTLETGNGTRYTTLYDGVEPGLCIIVENIGEMRTGDCTASLISAERVGDESDAPLEIFEPILLPWSLQDRENNLTTKIDPGTSQRVWVAEISSGGFAWILRESEKLPSDYQQIFGKPGIYHATLLISDGVSISVRVKIELTCEEGQAVEGSGYITGSGHISILEQDYLHPLHLSTAT